MAIRKRFFFFGTRKVNTCFDEDVLLSIMFNIISKMIMLRSGKIKAGDELIKLNGTHLSNVDFIHKVRLLQEADNTEELLRFRFRYRDENGISPKKKKEIIKDDVSLKEVRISPYLQRHRLSKKSQQDPTKNYFTNDIEMFFPAVPFDELHEEQYEGGKDSLTNVALDICTAIYEKLRIGEETVSCYHSGLITTDMIQVPL